MTEDQFTELVNLYLDKEISEEQLERLKSECETNANRKEAFRERCRLHEAMRLALNPEMGRSPGRRHRSRSRSARPGNGPRSGQRHATGDRRSAERREPVGSVQFPRWILGSGIAASVMVAALVLPSFFRDTTHRASQPELVGVTDTQLVERDPLDAIGKAELRRFASIQEQREINRSASLVAQMRLLGLSPDLTPEEKELREVSLAAVEAPRRSISQAEMLRQIQELRAMPEPHLIHLGADTRRASSPPSWPGGFQASLASFGE
jgi:hypothetical protein